jgi:TPR repeat protein
MKEKVGLVTTLVAHDTGATKYLETRTLPLYEAFSPSNTTFLTFMTMFGKQAVFWSWKRSSRPVRLPTLCTLPRAVQGRAPLGRRLNCTANSTVDSCQTLGPCKRPRHDTAHRFATSSTEAEPRERHLLSTSVPTSGEQAWQMYHETLAQRNEYLEQEQVSKSRAMYQAWERATQTSKQSQHQRNQAGVTVVKTLVKQTQKQQQATEQQERMLAEYSTRAHLYLQQAVEFKYPPAMVLLANQMIHEAGEQWRKMAASETNVICETLNKAVDLYRRAGDLGSGEAFFNLGNLLWTGFPDQTTDEEESDFIEGQPSTIHLTIALERDTTESLQVFRSAIALGDTDAMYFVGATQLSAPVGTIPLAAANPPYSSSLANQKQWFHEGLELVKRAANNGHGGAMYYLALLYLNGHDGLGILPCEPADFVGRLNLAVEQGDNADALVLRGHSYFHGENGYPPHFGQAFQDFIRAAETHEHADAAVSAGAMLHRGYPGVPQDRQRAFQLYQYAGELGSMEGWRNVVACYLTGEGVPESREAANYIRKTILKDHP